MYPLVPTPAGWRFDRTFVEAPYAPDLDINEFIELQNGLTFVTVEARLARENVAATFCLDALLWPVEDGQYFEAANEHLDRVRDRVVRRARAILGISGAFEMSMALLEAELRPRRAVAA